MSDDSVCLSMNLVLVHQRFQKSRITTLKPVADAQSFRRTIAWPVSLHVHVSVDFDASPMWLQDGQAG